MEFSLKNYCCSQCKENVTRTLLIKQGFSIVQCLRCGFVYVNPRVENEQLSGIYEHHYFKNMDFGYVDYEQEKRLRVKNFERWLKDAQNFIPAGKQLSALDVGCAAGYCLDVMKGRGWTAEGLELDEEMCARLRSEGQLVYKTPLADFNGQGLYDVITLFDVIEHIPDLDASFGKLRSLIKPGGIILLVTPDHNSWQRKFFGKKWFQYKPIEHIHYFTRRSLQSFGLRHGLKMVIHKSCGQYADAQFIVNRLSYYHFPLLRGMLDKIFFLFRLKNIFFYTDTGSSFVIFKSI